jgi:hypothetical protein
MPEGKDDVGVLVHDDLESQVHPQNTEQKKSPICAEICGNIGETFR